MSPQTLDERARTARDALRGAAEARVAATTLPISARRRRAAPRYLALAAVLIAVVVGATTLAVARRDSRVAITPATATPVISGLPTGTSGMLVGTHIATYRNIEDKTARHSVVTYGGRDHRVDGWVVAGTEDRNVLYVVTMKNDRSGSAVVRIPFAANERESGTPFSGEAPGPIVVIDNVMWVGEHEADKVGVWELGPTANAEVLVQLEAPAGTSTTTPARPGATPSETHASVLPDWLVRVGNALVVAGRGTDGRGHVLSIDTPRSLPHEFFSSDADTQIASDGTTLYTLAGSALTEWHGVEPRSPGRAVALPRGLHSDGFAVGRDTVWIRDGRDFWSVNRATGATRKAFSTEHDVTSVALAADGRIIVYEADAQRVVAFG